MVAAGFNNKFVVLGLVAFVVVASVFAQNKISTTQRALRELERKTADTLAAQGKILGDQSTKLTNQGKALENSKAAEAFLRNELNSVTSTRTSNSSLSSSLIATISPSIVKVICASDVSSNHWQQGTGTLYRASGSYFVRTNIHVVATEDGSTSNCAIAIYPKAGDSTSYLIFQSTGYQYYERGIDVAILIPKLISGEDHAGAFSDLAKFARDESKSPVCGAVNTGDHLVVLGYPGVGGSTLTVTDGIVSGFEDEYGVRYIKTSAKIEHGNSGGLALLDSGCVIGIPTFVQAGEIESIGRILDLKTIQRLTLH